MHQAALDYDNFWATVGVHPDTEDMTEPSVQDLVERAALPRVVAIGETGLDYYGMEDRKGGRTIADLNGSASVFARISGRRRSRKAAGHPHPQQLRRHPGHFARVRRGRFRHPGRRCLSLFHQETAEVARAGLDMGYYISLSGIVTFKNAQHLRDVAAFVPLDRLLIETDSPYLAPVPYRGKTNNPSYVPFVARQIAEVRGISIEEVAAATSANFDRLFKGVTLSVNSGASA